jgi:hypothetical protein
MDRRVGDPRRFHHDRGGRHLLVRAVDSPSSTRSATANWCSKPYLPDILTVPWLAVLLIAAVVALSLPASANGDAHSESTGEIASGSTLPRNVVLTLSEVRQVLPEMSQETATGDDETALGNPRDSRSVTYATADGSRRVVISVAQYQSAQDASSVYRTAVQGSLEAPGASGGEAVANLGEQAFVGVSAQGGETHVGGGALYGDLIANVTLQAYDGTTENRARVTELIRMEAAAATRAL